ncbi:hypothetical protein [Natrinema sp. 1APR25-10V2]|uniref:hypothetical protein n=1 Tax=Natrinema sp. 1APR25-10V2 TaxID=2951081 RepID=UPI002875DBF3|nr:hypothetical protein [Natrinema sp. 1APR25-10V2]MDS0474507.1 hypothetical protein [Natrinema sp. 1APR25-10V2]
MSTRGESEYTAPTKYDDYPGKADYGSVTTRFEGEIELIHPAPDIETLLRTTHLTAQLHQYNRAQHGRDWSFPNDGTTLYDVAILDVIDKVVEVEGLSPDSLEISTRRFKLLFLKEARQPRTLTAFYTDLKNFPSVLAKLGYSDASDLPSYETVRIELKKNLPEELADLERGQEAFKAAVIRAIYAVFRNGIKVPESVSEKYRFDAVAPPLYERAIPRSIEQDALRNWVQLLLDETINPLTFHRDKPRISIEQYLGLFAASAFSGCGVQTVANTFDYVYQREMIPKGSGVGKYIRNDLPLNASQAALENTEKHAITKQFDAVHRETLKLADQYGFFSEDRSLAVDLYRIEWNGVENDLTINRPPKSENDNRSQWTYAVFGIIDTEARFTLGARWLPEKSAYPRAVNQLTPISNDFVDVKALYADSELISGALINAFRRIADSSWAVRAPNEKTVITPLKEYTPENHIGYVPAVSWNTTPSPAAVAYPYDSSNPSIVEFTAHELKRNDPVDTKSQTDFSDFDDREETPGSFPSTLTKTFDDPESVPGVGNGSTHAVYLTDRSLPERSGEGIHFPYYQRWAIEESINQISNDFMPIIHSGNENLRLYGVNVAILFQNWHTLINRALSPELGLRRNVTHQELLMAILDVTFSTS